MSGNIHRDAHGGQAGILPCLVLGTGVMQHPGADWQYQAAVFGQRNEVGGGNEPQFRAAPADQCFDAADAAMLER